MKKLKKLSLSELKTEMPVVGKEEASGLAGGAQTIGSETWYGLKEYHDLVESGQWPHFSGGQHMFCHVLGLKGTVAPETLSADQALELYNNGLGMRNGDSYAVWSGSGLTEYSGSYFNYIGSEGNVFEEQYTAQGYPRIFSGDGSMYVPFNVMSNYYAARDRAYAAFGGSYSSTLRDVTFEFDGEKLYAYRRFDTDGSNGPNQGGDFLGSF